MLQDEQVYLPSCQFIPVPLHTWNRATASAAMVGYADPMWGAVW